MNGKKELWKMWKWEGGVDGESWFFLSWRIGWNETEIDDQMINIRMIEYLNSDCDELWKGDGMWLRINGFYFENIVVIKVWIWSFVNIYSIIDELDK